MVILIFDAQAIYMRNLISILFLIASFIALDAQSYSKIDSIRGSITPERAWWDLTHYHLKIAVDTETKFFKGSNEISYTVLEENDVLQIDLQSPLKITSVVQNGQELKYSTIGDSHHFIKLTKKGVLGNKDKITVFYEGIPHEAIRAPWDGGISWKTDTNGNPFVASSCQGIGASIWWPCKDHMYDEVESMDISITTPKGLMNVSNGRLISIDSSEESVNTYHWQVKNPINNYGVNLSIGDYVHFNEVYEGEAGALDCDYFVLRDNLEKAKVQFKQVPQLLEAFEHWFGPYPFYEDGFKLIEVPYLGMEHQSAVTYGNGYKNGYRGTDLSDTGWGMKFDYIIIHEAGHEWFANNITYQDIADMWIHESFTTYSESLFIEYFHGTDAGAEYIRGMRRLINNDGPIIASYGVNAKGSGDMYFKGSNIIHTLRQVVSDDTKWRELLRGLNKKFYHQTITSKEFERYISEVLAMDLAPFFNQYLRTNNRPTLEYYYTNGNLRYRWNSVVDGFNMPIKVIINDASHLIEPVQTWRELELDNIPISITIDVNYYVVGSEIIH
ncbi:MAG: aminopeptidase N [Saprospiraceae bacterium]